MNTIIVYDTLTGNTETSAEYVRSVLTAQGYNVDFQKAAAVQPGQLANYDLVVVGSPTYGVGELTDDFDDFVAAMEGLDLSGKKAAVFGLGDADQYPDEFCSAVETLESRLKACGADLITDGLPINGDPEDSEDAIKRWAQFVAEQAEPQHAS